MIKLIFLILAGYIWVSHADSIGEKRKISYNRFLETIAHDSPALQMEKINDYFNQIVNDSDWVVWGEEDYWATPKELMKQGRGDCEDFAIAKYFALKTLGIDPSKMMILIVKVDGLSELHVVLGVKNTLTEIMILDNLSWKIIPLKKRSDLKIVRWVNETHLDRFDSPDALKLGRVIQKMKREE